MVASSLDFGETIRITDIYAPIDICSKIQFWAHIRYVRSCAPCLPWIVGGDFNFVLSLEKKRGGLSRLGHASNLFRAQVDSLSLVDVKPYNGTFTWSNRWSGHEAIYEKLDKFLCLLFLGRRWLGH